MKKLIYSAAALSLAFFAASCQQENLETVAGDNFVTYTVQVPNAIATKVIGEKDADIAAVNELVYAVYRTEATEATDYDAAETKLFQKTATITNGTARVSFELVNNQNFRVLFWAQVDQPEGEDIYSTGDLKNVTLAQALSANAEAYAAFAGSDYIKSGDDISGRTITLRRPVSQLNIATTPQSLNLEGQTDVEIETTAVTVNGLSNVYNVATGLAEGQATEFVYDATNPAALSEQELTVNGIAYKYISMNYVGFAGASDNASVTYYINTKNVGNIFNTIDNVPFKANYRTNIIGNLITSTSDYVIELDRNWAGEFISASNASEFADALANAQSGDIVNVAEGEYDLPSSLFDQANSGTFTIAGSGAATVMNGAVNTNNQHPGNYAFGKHIVLKDLTYVTTNNGYNGGFGHAASVTFINCTIIGQMYAHSGAPHYFYDCTIDPLTGYLYTYASDCVFEGCTFTASEGKALQIYSDGTDGVHSVTIKDCDFVAAKQAQTWDGKPVTGIDINSNGAIFNVTVEDCTTTGFPTGLNSNSDLYNIKDRGLEKTNLVVDGVVVNRAGGFTKLAKYPNIWVKDNNYYVFDKAGLADLNAYFAANSMNNVLWSREYHIAADIDASGYTWNSVYVVVGNNANNGLVIDGNGHTISNLTLNGSFFTGTPNGGYEGTTPGYVKNITIDNANVNGDHYAAVFWGNTYGELVYENVTVKNTSVVANCNVGVFVGASTYEDGKGIDNILFKNCKVENCSVVANGKDGQDPTGASVFCGRAFGKTNLTFEGSTVDSATTVENKNGLVGGMYGYTTWYGTGFVSTGASDEIVDWNGVQLAAVVGDKVCNTLAEAAEAAKAGDTIQLIDDTSLSESLTLPAGVILDGNGKQINGTIVAGGDLTFVGHTKVTGFSASYYNRNITISQGACLEVTGTGRVSLAYGNTFNVTGNVADAKTIDKSTIKPSLIIPAGISITGGNDATINVTDAYVQIGSTTSKPGAANGEFTLNITNSIAEFTKEVGFYEPTGGMNPNFKLNLENSVLTTGTKMCIAAPNAVVSAKNSTITIGTYFRNSGVVSLDNSSLTGHTTQHGENSGNTGITKVDNNSSFTIIAPDKNHPLNGEDRGIIEITNGSNAEITWYKDLVITKDATSTFTGTEVQ